MTAKEAFDIIAYYVPPCFKEELETIEKDLTALESLKNHIEVNELEYSYQCKPKFVYYIDLIKKTLTKEEYDILKEVFKYDK